MYSRMNNYNKMLANDAAMFYCDIVYMCGCWCN